MTNAKAEKLLLERMAQAYVPPIPYRAEFFQTGESSLQPISLYPTASYRPGLAVAAGAAAAGFAAVSLLLHPGWQQELSVLFSSSRPSESDIPFQPSSSFLISSDPSNDTSTTSLQLNGTQRLLKRLAEAVPGLSPEYLRAEERWLNLGGHFTGRTENERIHLCLYHNTESDETPRSLLFLESGDDLLVQEFSFDNPVGISAVEIRDLTGDGLDEILIAHPNGHSSSAISIFTASDQILRLLLATDEDDKYNETALSPLDYGFAWEFFADYQGRLKNIYTGEEYPLDFSHMKDVESLHPFFDDEGRGMKDLELDGIWGYEFAEDGDQVQVIFDLSAWYGIPAETVGSIRLYMAYNPASDKLEIVKTAFAPHIPAVWENQPLKLHFSSGAGGWGTDLVLNRDGSFEGIYWDGDMGDQGETYPNGTEYICEFRGRFGNIRHINSYTYSMALREIELKHEGGEEWIEDGVRYIASGPYGLEGGTEFLLYTPDTPVSELSDEFLSWWPKFDRPEGTLSRYGLCNQATEQGFFIWK